jgi:hypothetical protein
MKLRTFLVAIIIAVASIGFVSVNAHAEMADGQSIYGAIVFNLAFYNQDKDYTGTKSDNDLSYDEINVNKIGVKGSKMGTSYQFEFGFRDANSSNLTYVRIAKVEANVGGIKLKIGQDYTTYTQLSSCLIGSPVFAAEKLATGYDGRTPQIVASMSGLFLAITQNSNVDSAGLGTTHDTVLPKLGVGYMGKTGDINFGAGFTYQTMKVDDGGSFDGKAVTSWAANVKASGKMGPLGFKFSFLYVTNPADFGLGAGGVATATETSGTSIKNTTGMGGFLEIDYNFGAGAFNGGVAYQQTKNDNWSKTDQSLSYFAQVKIGVAKGVTIMPGIQIKDGMKDGAGVKEGKQMWYGLVFIGSF